jgi:DNA-binding NtrC family response regulator
LENKNELRIAILDDEKDMLQALSILLEKLGYQSPSVFQDGTSLVRSMMIDRKSYDVLLIDYRMPEMNGIEAAKIIQRYRKETKIIMITGYEFVRKKASEIGIAFLLKPFTMGDLSHCLENLKLVDPQTLGS